MTSHYDNGLLKTLRLYNDDENGYRILFHSNGVLKSISQIRHGKAHGLKFSFTADGKFSKKDNYENGEIKNTF